MKVFDTSGRLLTTIGLHKDTHKSGGTDAFTAIDLLDAIVKRLQESGGATLLLGAVADGQFLKRSGTNVVGAADVGVYFVRGLSGQNDAVAPTTKFGWAAHAMQLWNPTTLAVAVFKNVPTRTNDITLAGPAANGRDQAAAFPAAIQAVHFYDIWDGVAVNPVTISSLAAPPTGPALPTGYTHWAYATTVMTDAVPNLRKVRVAGSMVIYESPFEILSGGVAVVETAVSVAVFVPAIALRYTIGPRGTAPAGGRIIGDAGSLAIGRAIIRIVSGFDFAALISFNDNVSLNQGINKVPTSIELLNLSQQFFYTWNVPNGTLADGLSLSIYNYRVPNGDS